MDLMIIMGLLGFVIFLICLWIGQWHFSKEEWIPIIHKDEWDREFISGCILKEYYTEDVNTISTIIKQANTTK